jgi:hypothetical protein
VSSMLDLAQGVRAQIIKETAPKVATQRIFTIQTLRHAGLWGATAAGALLVAVLSSRGEAGGQRLTTLFQGDRTEVATRNFDAKAETERLSSVVRGLAADGAEIKSRLASVEHDMDDVTGSISKEIEAADAARRSDNGPTITATAAVTAALTSTTPAPPSVSAFPPAAAAAPPDAAAPVSARAKYGVDIGSGLTLQALRARWATMRSAHPQLFEGLEPVASIKEVTRANRIELRLVVGPFAQAAAADQLCTALTAFGLFCQPTMFDGQRLAQR